MGVATLVCRNSPSPGRRVPYVAEYQMDLNDLKPSVRPQDRFGYVYHVVFKRPTDGHTYHYIGQHRTKTVDRNYVGSGTVLLRMYAKYGRHGSLHLIGWEASQEALNQLEIEFIRHAKALWGRDCINLNYAEQAGRHTAATRKRIGEAHKGKVLTEEHKKSLLGWYQRLTPEQKAEVNRRRSEKMKGVPKHAGHGAKVSAALMGHKLSEETKRKISAAHLARSRSPGG